MHLLATQSQAVKMHIVELFKYLPETDTEFLGRFYDIGRVGIKFIRLIIHFSIQKVVLSLG